MTYFNTNDLAGKDLARANAQADRQEDAVLAHFRRYPRALFTPEEIHRAVLPDAPLTSARRAITNLTTEGELVKTQSQRKGKYGKPVYCWRLNVPPQGQLLEQQPLL